VTLLGKALTPCALLTAKTGAALGTGFVLIGSGGAAAAGLESLDLLPLSVGGLAKQYGEQVVVAAAKALTSSVAPEFSKEILTESVGGALEKVLGAVDLINFPAEFAKGAQNCAQNLPALQGVPALVTQIYHDPPVGSGGTVALPRTARVRAVLTACRGLRSSLRKGCLILVKAWNEVYAADIRATRLDQAMALTGNRLHAAVAARNQAAINLQAETLIALARELAGALTTRNVAARTAVGFIRDSGYYVEASPEVATLGAQAIITQIRLLGIAASSPPSWASAALVKQGKNFLVNELSRYPTDGLMAMAGGTTEPGLRALVQALAREHLISGTLARRLDKDLDALVHKSGRARAARDFATAVRGDATPAGQLLLAAIQPVL
jgi:hypothetical protein